ncbi:unnamed protein product, partial [marine sediment metagenome]
CTFSLVMTSDGLAQYQCELIFRLESIPATATYEDTVIILESIQGPNAVGTYVFNSTGYCVLEWLMSSQTSIEYDFLIQQYIAGEWSYSVHMFNEWNGS